MKEFPKRHYQSLKQYWNDLRYIISHVSDIRAGVHKVLSPAFRERLMLIVTRINDCPYCMHVHTRLARAAGVPAFEIREIIEGQIPDDAPENELTALLYARDWAENNAQADETEINKLTGAYSQEKVDSINLALRLIWIGNLSGNTFDYFRYRLSFGKWGLKQESARKPAESDS